MNVLEPGRLLTIKYEDFVRRPARHLMEIAGFLDVDPDPYRRPEATAGITARNVGRGWRGLSLTQRGLAGIVIQDQLDLLGYPSVPAPERTEIFMQAGQSA
jgi:hypothetical protein